MTFDPRDPLQDLPETSSNPAQSLPHSLCPLSLRWRRSDASWPRSRLIKTYFDYGVAGGEGYLGQKYPHDKAWDSSFLKVTARVRRLK